MKSVRVFVSSAFLDMHAERDYLNRIVFPELRSRCVKRGAEFLGIDLRWGLTEEEARRRGPLAICLDEIDRCRPFFLSLLGDRYGWVPPPEQVPLAFYQSARRDQKLRPGEAALLDEWYQLDETTNPPLYRLRRSRDLPADVTERLADFWEAAGLEQAGESITAREILHGAFHPPKTHSFFYFRKPGLTLHPDFPGPLTNVFAEPDPRRRDKLRELRQRIREGSGPERVVRDYEAHFAGWRIEPSWLPEGLPDAEREAVREALKDGVIRPEELKLLGEPARQAIQSHGTVALTGMEELGRLIVEDLWGAIETFFERHEEPTDAHGRERAYHERFLAERTRLFYGRHETLERMLGYAEGREERSPLAVTGPPGSGKSSLMAECARRCQATFPEALVLPYFIGAVPGSTDLTFCVTSLCESLRRGCGLEEEVSADPDRLQLQLQTFLAKAAARRPVVLVLDALNQLDPAHRSHELNWIPFHLPPGARVIVSTLPGSCLDSIRRRVPPDAVLDLPALPSGEREDLVRGQLARRSKKLTEQQLTRLLDTRARPDAGLPLYLLVAVEELCLCGDRAALERRLEHLPAALPELFAQVLERLEHDHTFAVAESVLSRLAVSRSGLLESEIVEMLSGDALDVPRAHWAQFYRALEFYLSPMDETSRAGLINFFHDQLRFAVYRRYLKMVAPEAEPTEAYRGTHDRLASYFKSITRVGGAAGGWSTDHPHGLSELPFHMAHAGRVDELRELLLDFDWMQAKLGTLGATSLITDYDFLPDDADVRLVEGALRRAAHVLARESNELAGQLLGRLLSYKSPPVEALLGRAASWRSAPWLRPLTPSLARPGDPSAQTFLGVPSVAITADLRQVVSASDEGIVKVWDVPSDAELRAMGSYTPLRNAVAVTPDGRRAITSAEDQTLRVWAPLEGGAELWALKGHTARVTAVAITPDGRWAVSASEDQTLRVWDVEQGGEVPRFAGHVLSAHALALTPDGRRAVSASSDGALRVWDVENGTELPSAIRHGDAARALAITPDGRRAVSSSDETLKLWDLDAGSELHTFAGHTGLIRTAVVTPDGRHAVSGSDDINLIVWDLEERRQAGKLEGHYWSVTAAAVTPDGRHAVSASGDETINVWDFGTLKVLQTLRGPTRWVNGLAVTPDGRHVISVARDKALSIWDARTGAALRTLTGHTEWVNAVAVTPDGRLAVSGADDCTLKLWDLSSGDEIDTLSGHGNGISSVAVTPDGRLAVSGCWDSTLKVWDLKSRSEVMTLPGHPTRDESGWVRAVAVTPDGRRAVSASHDGTLKVWDIRSGAELLTLRGHTGWVMAVAVMPDGESVISGSADGSLKLWDLESGDPLLTLRGHTGFVTGVAVAARGRRVVSTSEDHTLKVWDLEEAAVIASFTGDGQLRACALTPDGQTIIAGENSGRIHFLSWA